jgi:hypothetical protein
MVGDFLSSDEVEGYPQWHAELNGDAAACLSYIRAYREGLPSERVVRILQ